MNRPSIVRVFLTFNLFLCWASVLVSTRGISTLNRRVGLADILPLEWMLSQSGWVLVSLVYGVALGCLLFRIREDLVGWVLMVCTALFVGLEMSVQNMSTPKLHFLLAGVLLGSWLVSRAWAKRMDMETAVQDEWGHEAMAGSFGAMLVLAAGSKVFTSGLDWFDGGAQCAVMFEHALLAPDTLLTPLRQTMAQQMWFCSLSAVGVLAIELLGAVMVWPTLRRAYAVMVVLLFVSLFIFHQIFEPGWPMMACALAWSRMGDPRP